jgi:hypothetical protein
MTLKKKFKQWLDTNPRLEIREVQLEKIADYYAIDFAEWYLNLYKSYGWEKFDNNTNKQLLEIFKIEKRL